MTYWTWNTARGEFRIEEIGPSRIDLLFEELLIGSYSTPQEAAGCCGAGHHAQISEEFDAGSLGVSRSLTDWRQARAADSGLRDDQMGVLAELRSLSPRSDRPRGTLHLARSR